MNKKQKREQLIKMKLQDQRKSYLVAFLLQLIGCGRLYTGDYGIRLIFAIVIALVPPLGGIRLIVDFFLLYARIIDINKNKEDMIRKEIDLIS